MYNFQGISPKALNLLAENKYHDSKSFYEEHKEELKTLATVPMRKLIVDLSELLIEIDEEIYVNPTYGVSRIRRDTRFSKNKTLYRENLWIMFRRNKNLYSNCPFMWFEFSPELFTYGIALFTEKPGYMEEFRNLIEENPKKFLAALKSVKTANLNWCGDMYKKIRFTNEKEEFLEFYNAKNIQFMKTEHDIRKLGDEKIVDELKYFIRTVKPMYDFLLEFHNKITEKE